MFHKIFVIGNLRLDEATFEIGMNDPGRLGSVRALHNGPGPDFLRTAGIEGLQTECRAAAPDNAGNHGFDVGLGTLEAQLFSFFRKFLEECFLSRLVVFQIGKILLKFTTHRNDLSSTMGFHPFPNFGQPFTTLTHKILLGHIDNVNLWFGRNETPISYQLDFGIFEIFTRLNGRVAFQQLGAFLVRTLKGFRQGRFGRTGYALFFANSILLSLQHFCQSVLVFQTQFGLNRFHITNRIDGIIDVDDFIIVKGPDEMKNSIHGRNVR
mmetsp:Transcript_28812/g.42534  ORF Transcript_28812/g.42534 Transcript_28812/m.42534 type:complete len:267 (-) Transcript_28812:466-1266(-)